MSRVGAVDLGTNSTRLLVADVEHDELIEIERLLTITRMGHGVDAHRQLAPEAVARVHRALDRYHEVAANLGAETVLAAATSAARDADDGRDFLADLERRYGFRTRLLTGGEEALLTYRGVCSGRSAGPGTLICDIGGGSTELVLGGEAGVERHVSLDIGCVRLQERFLGGDPPARGELEALRRAVAETLPGELTGLTRELVGVAGTVTSLAAIDLELEREIPEIVDGHALSAASVERLLARLAAMSLAERRGVRGLMPERAPTIVAGAGILAEVLRACGLERLSVSERDILQGIALEAASASA